MSTVKKPRSNSKRRVMLLGLLGALIALGISTRTWITVQPAVGTVKIPLIEVAGSDAATAVAALAVVALAGSLAAMIAGKIARWIIAVILLLAGGGIAGSGIVVLSDPVAAAATKVGEATGLNASDGVYDVGIWPWFSILAGLLLVAAALLLAITGRHWKSSRKYARDAAAGAPASGGEASEGRIDEITGWDSLSRGDDPTG